MTMNQAEKQALIALSLTEGIGPALGGRLIEAFGSAEAAATAGPEEIRRLTGINPKISQGLPKALDRAEREINRLGKMGGWVVLLGEESYPRNLAQIYAPPLALFGLGEPLEPEPRALAVVGSRRATGYGRRVVHCLAREAAGLGVTIVSGLAMGIDAQAHAGALEANGGKTAAVLGCGLDVPYPKRNQKLKAAIIESGSVVSEYPLGTTPKGWRFPVRNRIIAGLSSGVVVGEATLKSGSLITANLAADFGRTVMAVPGPVGDPGREGTHKLIRDGAVLVASGRQAVAELWPAMVPDSQPAPALFDQTKKPPGLDSQAEAIYRLLEGEPKHVDEIIRQLGLNPGEALGRLLDLELKGLARQLPGQCYVRI